MPDQGPPGPKSADAPPAPETVAPGALSALLAELVGAPETPAPEPAAGTVIGRFELTRRLGAGGFGVVWEARDRQLGRTVAFKLIRPGERAELREQSLLREAEAAARLSHDNIVALHDVGKSQFGPFLVLELLRGQTLAERLAGGPLTPAEAVRIVRDVTRGVAHAHAAGVVHRDLKPANVFLCDDGRVKVLDFGLAHAFGRRRQSGGTPAYMAPEQWKDAPEDERTDVFALGVILYQALSGTLPFAGEKEAVGSGRAPVLEVAAAPELGPLVARMLEKDPLKRPRDAGAVLKALDAALAALGAAGAGAGAPSAGTAPMVRIRRHPGWRLAGFIAAGIAIGVAAALGVNHLRSRPTMEGGRPLVAVADVVNETGEQELDVLSGLLVTSLEQSRKLAVMTQARVLDLAAQAGRTGPRRVDEALGREVGKRSGVTTLLLPVIRRLGTTYAVELRAVDPVHDQHLFTLTDRSTSKEGLFDLLDRLSEKARRELHEDPAALAGSRIALGESTTRSLEAYQHYTAGMEAWYRDGQRALGLRELEEAVRLDPQFAVAHALLASLYASLYQRPDLASEHRRAALESMDRMPEKERTLLRLYVEMGLNGMGRRTGNGTEGLRLANELLQRFPEDKLVLAGAGLALQVLGQGERAEATYRRALALDPGYRYVANLLLNRLVAAKDPPAAALALARRAVASRRTAANVILLAEALAYAGDLAGAAAAAREALVLDAGRDVANASGACLVLNAAGVAAECVPVYERLMAAGTSPLERDAARNDLVEALAAQGRIREALRLSSSVEETRRGRPAFLATLHSIGRPRLDAPGALPHVRRIPGRSFRRMSLAYFGQLEEAERLSATFQASDRDEMMDRAYQQLADLARGRHAEAVEAVRDLIKLSGGPQVATSYLLAEALLAAGRPAEAAEVRPPLQAWPTEDSFEIASEYPRLALVRARAMEQLGRRADAVKELDALLAFWKEADADLPLLVEAKAMRARLVGR